MVAVLYINASYNKDSLGIRSNGDIESILEVNLETLLVLNIYKLCDNGRINLQVIPQTNLLPPVFNFHIKSKKTDSQSGKSSEVCDIVSLVKLPALVQISQEHKCKSIVAGICSVTRQLIKCSGDSNTLFLLGFRESCLAACSESSIWTKFCEVDMVATVRNVLNSRELSSTTTLLLPDDLARFEYHMQQPVRMHNVYNVARVTQNDKSIKSNVPISDLKIAHNYSEGPVMTLSDIILFPSFYILMKFVFPIEVLRTKLPLTCEWLEKMQGFKEYNQLIEFSMSDKVVMGSPFTDLIKLEINSDIKKGSLYTSDPNRYKPANRIYTKQDDIENALNVIDTKHIPILRSSSETFGAEVAFDWENIPMILRPEGGALPKNRSKRKEEQLENLVKAVVKIVQMDMLKGFKLKIVDFCSGSGHLGLLLAYLLPKCTVILVENKEKSLERAINRINVLNLTNLIVIQSNLDYFQGTFDIGVSLHACGVATDLVMQNCINHRAHFVCCPCCYGGIHDCYHLKFPRSGEFARGVMNSEYLKIAHAADQTHDKENCKTLQGYHCMDIIDSDRWLYAKGCSYDVYLTKLKPDTCTPKNNLLVGVYQKKIK